MRILVDEMPTKEHCIFRDTHHYHTEVDKLNYCRLSGYRCPVAYDAGDCKYCKAVGEDTYYLLDSIRTYIDDLMEDKDTRHTDALSSVQNYINRIIGDEE